MARRSFPTLAVVQKPVLELCAEPVTDLRQHSAIPSIFETSYVLEVRASGCNFELEECTLSEPLRKTYDDYEDPLAWSRDFDTSQWVLISAFVGGERVGGVIVAAHTAGVEMLEGRSDLAVVWDLRVAPAHRRHSIAASLLAAAQTWASTASCIELKVETQNTNPAACKLYLSNGFILSAAQHHAYRELPDDVRLIWRKRLDG
jgi:GNAT superfamily N-acetyltransferase